MSDMTAQEQQNYDWMQSRKKSYLQKAGVTDLEITGKNIKPSSLSSLPLEKQQKLIDLIRGNYNTGFAFFGTPGTGKTTLANLLFKAAIIKRVTTESESGGAILPINVWRTTARTLCQQAQDRSTGREENELMFLNPGELMAAQARIVSRERILRAANAGLRPHLFIEEWDKVGLTDFRRETMFDILDAIYSAGGQLVMTSNLTWDDFCETFGGVNWRISQNCYVVEMFEKVTITPPKRELAAYGLD